MNPPRHLAGFVIVLNLFPIIVPSFTSLVLVISFFFSFGRFMYSDSNSPSVTVKIIFFRNLSFWYIFTSFVSIEVFGSVPINDLYTCFSGAIEYIY